MSTDGDFFADYLEYSSGNEIPIFFNRWCALAGVGAYLGRNFWFHHGHTTIYPNMYCMLIGNPGTRKSAAIKMMKRIMKAAGYETIAANKTSKEKFLMDLADNEFAEQIDPAEDMLDKNLWGINGHSHAAECFVMADEFNNFIGLGNTGFISLLTELWDYEGIFRDKIKTGKSVAVNDPTISILGGNTSTGFSTAFPTEILGQGFFSRLLLIYGEPNGKRITFPRTPSKESTEAIASSLQRIRNSCSGASSLSLSAESLLDKIYHQHLALDDIRFESYFSRRFQHLVKLCLVIAASNWRNQIVERDVVTANTILTHTEYLMPKALGEFGKARHSDTSHKVMALLDSTHEAVSFKEIWTHVRSDLEKMGDLSELIRNLVAADKVQALANGEFLPKKKIVEQVDSDVLDYSILTQEEKDIAR